MARPEALRWAWHAARTIPPRNRSYPIPKPSPCSCAQSSSTSPPIARPSKTQGRATQAIQPSIHPGRANPTRSRTQKNPCSAFFRVFCGHQMKPQKTQKYAEVSKGSGLFDEGWDESRVGPGGPTHVLRKALGSQFVIPIAENHATGSLSTLNSFTKASFGRCAPFEPFPLKPIVHPLEGLYEVAIVVWSIIRKRCHGAPKRRFSITRKEWRADERVAGGLQHHPMES